MLQDIPLPFGEWLPDLGENENPGLVEAKNVIPRLGGYSPLRGFGTNRGSQIPAGNAVLSVFGYETSGGALTFDAGKDTQLFVGGSATTTPSAGIAPVPWRFARFDNKIFAVRGDPTASTESHLWQHDIGTTTYSNVVLQGLRGRSIAKVGRFLLIGSCNVLTGSAAPDPYSFRWSAFNNPVDFVPSQTTQAGIATVNSPELGAITAIVGGRNPLLFQQYGVSRIAYVGPPKVWEVQEISRQYGSVSDRTTVTVGDLTYFISQRGVCVTDGASVQRIGDERVTKWVSDNLNGISFGLSTGAALWNSQVIIWSVNAGVVSGTAGVDARVEYNDYLIYSYLTNRFTRASGFTTGGAYYYDPTVSASSDIMLKINGDSTFRPAVLDGDTLAAEVTTGYTSLAPGRRIDVTNVEPVYDGSGAKVAINTKQTQAGAAAAGTPVAVNSLGIADVRASGRLAAVSVTFDAGAEWSDLKGAVVTADVSGAR